MILSDNANVYPDVGPELHILQPANDELLVAKKRLKCTEILKVT